MSRYPCDFCPRVFSRGSGISVHLKAAHGIVRGDQIPRTKRSTIGKAESQATPGFARLQRIAVRGRNANSAGLWELLSDAMFPKRGVA